VRLPNATNETELKEFFGEAKDAVGVFIFTPPRAFLPKTDAWASAMQIIRVHFPPPRGGEDRKIAYVEFGDEEGMKAGLEKHAEVCLVSYPRPFLS
jgi:hypothetical protein